MTCYSETSADSAPIQSDATRSKNLEHIIAQRVAAELDKLRMQQSQQIDTLQTQISTESDAAPSSEPLSIRQQMIRDITGEPTAEQKRNDTSSDSVKKEIESLRKKLEERKKVESMDSAVEKARNEVVGCLRLNDRRPLDCWKEVEDFRNEVGRLEREFVKRV